MCQEFIDDEQGSNAHSRLGNRSNPNLQSAASRLYALKNLLAIGKREPELVLNILQERYKLYFKKRYFPDSKIHYEKLRILQAMLLLVSEKGFPEDLRERTSCFVLKNLQEESNQNCIKQILNCILIFLLKDVFLLIKWMKSIPEMSPAVLISVVPAIYHLTLLGDENALQAVVEVLLPWTMGPQLKSRVYSQVCIQRLIEHGRKMKYTTFVSRNEHLAGCIDSVLKETGAIYTNTLALDLIVLKYFHPHQHVPWLCLFCDLPRLNKVGQVEWQNLQFLLDNSTSEIYIDKLQHIEFCKATETFSTRKTVCDSLETNENMNGMSQLQTKIVPWKTALDQTSTEANSDFILVASLIDKAQNLGGLSRTCEVFGIQNVVFHNAKITDEKEFKSLSMSSESWINRFEVKVKDLRDYLWALKSQSYRIIGAEQTVGSQQLDKFSFPRKIALVLGNEKTGIPPDIIPLLDTCLEIPQFGLTRSLNVHVAGAMFMWEFVKQHGRKPSVD
ncbi:probable methyltransferase TARBP1 isoform X5 [Dendroctonus ponderosae]|nr:probable methyltransferase TARBP1 isoform X5 [Dendroctonus ponderosae]XP_048516960.1 probable methyltransferase TARBP1 isoform X5 [Dendroctonus ponderosae]XP_048516961.1 probable methyltransferase TARBP1 isoform X5 [Dendroctonus ponderosae]